MSGSLEDINILINETIPRIQKYWYSKYTPLLLIIATIFIYLHYIDIKNNTLLKFFLLILICLIFIMLWLKSCALPKNKKGYIGFAVAICTENEKQRTKLTQDFIHTLRKLLLDSTIGHNFYFLDIPSHHAEQINFNCNNANEIFKKIQCHFMIYGRERVRLIDKNEMHLLNLEGIVSHTPIPSEISEKISMEFAELMPRNIRFPTENDVFSFEVTSEWVNLVAMYIIGIASFVSGDVNYSNILFDKLFLKISNSKNDYHVINKLRYRVPYWRTKSKLVLASHAYEQWVKHKTQYNLIQLKTYLDELHTIAPSNYPARLLRAIWFFLQRDLTNAKREVRKCTGTKDGVWRYSMAFLDAYVGNLKLASRRYMVAFKYFIQPGILLNTEEFIAWVINEEPDKVQLYYILGLINYYKKQDKIRAMQDFQRFLDLTLSCQFEEQRTKSMDFIKDIRVNLSDSSK